MYKISTMDDGISIESGGKGSDLLMEALAIVSALHSVLSNRSKHAGNIFMKMCLDGIPFSDAVKGDVEDVEAEVEEHEQEQGPSQEERNAIIDRLVDIIFSAHRDDDTEGDMDES